MSEMAFVSPEATIGKDVRIGEFVVIEAGAVIGDGASVADFALVQEGARIGAKTKIGTYCKVGRDVVMGENCSFTSYCEIRDNCILGDGVSMGSRCTLSAGTRVGDGVIIKYGFVVTDTPVLQKNNEKITGKLGSRSRFGANVVIMPGVSIGKNSEIGACSQVRHDVPDNEVWYGNPARFYKKIL